MLTQEQLDAIPREVRELRQWLPWRWELNPPPDKKPDKILVDSNDGRDHSDPAYYAKWKNPDCWLTFEDAVEAMRAGNFEGVGYIFAKFDPFAGVDYDYCFDPETETIEPWADERIPKHTYCEISPSGRGIKCIGYGKMPGDGAGHVKNVQALLNTPHPKAEIGCYSQGRWFAFTGRALNGSRVREMQATIDRLDREIFAVHDQPAVAVADIDPRHAKHIRAMSDDRLLHIIRRSKQGSKFGRLWKGDSSGYASGSEADFALCAMLSWWTGRDEDRVLRLFLRSTLGQLTRVKKGEAERTARRACQSSASFWSPDEHGEGLEREINDLFADTRELDTIPPPAVPGKAPRPVTEQDWRPLFHTFAEFENAPPLSFAIKGFLQNDAATVIGGLAGHDKTWVMLSIAKALLKGKGTALWGHFEVLETAQRIVYLIPESTIGPFGHRLKLMGLMGFVRDDRLLVRTLSKGPRLPLGDARILSAANGAYVMLDTLARFTEGDENSAAEFQALASDVFALLGSGARAIVAAHHSPKSFAKDTSMSLEAMLRGTGDIGAIFATGWGVKQIDKDTNVLHIENLKARDFDAPRPFQLAGRPHIDLTGDFVMLKKPGECGALADEQEPERKGGASNQAREARAANLELLRQWLAQDPHATSEGLSSRFKSAGITVKPGTVRRYKSELGQ